MIDTDVLPEMAVHPWKGPGVVLFESVPERDLSDLLERGKAAGVLQLDDALSVLKVYISVDVGAYLLAYF